MNPLWISVFLSGEQLHGFVLCVCVWLAASHGVVDSQMLCSVGIETE